MMENSMVEKFLETAIKVGAEVQRCGSVEEAVTYIAERAGGTVALPSFATGERLGLAASLREAGCEVVTEVTRQVALAAAAGVTGANFAMADTGSVVLESTPEDIRLATTFPTRHFVLLDPKKIVADGIEAAAPMRAFHEKQPRNYLAYITGPSRTADIERVLTIGVHGPKKLDILLVEGLSDDLLEM